MAAGLIWAPRKDLWQDHQSSVWLVVVVVHRSSLERNAKAKKQRKHIVEY